MTRMNGPKGAAAELRHHTVGVQLRRQCDIVLESPVDELLIRSAGSQRLGDPSRCPTAGPVSSDRWQPAPPPRPGLSLASKVGSPSPTGAGQPSARKTPWRPSSTLCSSVTDASRPMSGQPATGWQSHCTTSGSTGSRATPGPSPRAPGPSSRPFVSAARSRSRALRTCSTRGRTCGSSSIRSPTTRWRRSSRRRAVRG